MLKKVKNRLQRARRVRSKISGTAEMPRLSVFRSNAHIYAQVIDDESGVTLCSAHDKKASGTKTDRATAVGAELGKIMAEK